MAQITKWLDKEQMFLGREALGPGQPRCELADGLTATSHSQLGPGARALCLLSVPGKGKLFSQMVVTVSYAHTLDAPNGPRPSPCRRLSSPCCGFHRGTPSAGGTASSVGAFMAPDSLFSAMPALFVSF